LALAALPELLQTKPGPSAEIQLLDLLSPLMAAAAVEP
jgi:hypothetical protein